MKLAGLLGSLQSFHCFLTAVWSITPKYPLSVLILSKLPSSSPWTAGLWQVTLKVPSNYSVQVHITGISHWVFKKQFSWARQVQYPHPHPPGSHQLLNTRKSVRTVDRSSGPVPNLKGWTCLSAPPACLLSHPVSTVPIATGILIASR